MNPTAEKGLWIFLGAVISGAVAVIYSRLFRNSDARKLQIIEDKKKLTALETQMAVIMAEAKPIAAFVLAMATAKMTHLHTPETDVLLEKAKPPSTLTDPEIEELALALKERVVVVNGEVDEEERIYAKIYPDLLRLEKIESAKMASGDGPPIEAVLVAVPKVTGETETENLPTKKGMPLLRPMQK